MRRRTPRTRVETASRERGSALVIALIVSFVLSLLGIAFLFMAQAESHIAQNERRAAEALYVAEAGVRVVRSWFDRPGTAVGFPTDLSVVDRSQRRIVDESDPYGVDPATLPATPEYKDTDDRLFERPYRGSVEDSFRGAEGFPDVLIDRENAATRAFLDQISDDLFDDFPGANDAVQARIRRIEVYAPPYVEQGATWQRFGIGTVRVTGGIYREESSGAWRTEAERTITVVLSETPYKAPRPYGPLHVCGDLAFDGDVHAHWGAVTAVRDATGGTIPVGPPRGVPPGPRVDELFRDPMDYTDDCDAAGSQLHDPWLRLAVGGTIAGADTSNPPQVEAPSAGCADGSNRYHRFEYVACPSYVYEVWKGVALSGLPDVHYFPVVDGNYVDEQGASILSFEAATSGRQGLFFFDTRDGLPPHDDTGDGTIDNLGPGITVSGGWYASGFFFLNANLDAGLTPCDPGACGATYRAPGEPFADDGNGTYDGTEPWINLDYPTNLDDRFPVDETDDLGGSVVRNERGVEIPEWASFRGVLYTTGGLDMTGTGRIYGSVIVEGDAHLASGSLSTGIFWDETILGNWPPPEYTLPRVVFTSWRTD